MKLVSVILLLSAFTIMACHKTNHRVNGIYGQWKWVQTNWTFATSSGTTYPGPDTTYVLQLNADSTFSIQLNGKVRTAEELQLKINCQSGICDSTLLFNVPSPPYVDAYFVSGTCFASIRHDTLTLLNTGSQTPAGSSTEYLFIPYP